jgi:hypothetical protein
MLPPHLPELRQFPEQGLQTGEEAIDENTVNLLFSLFKRIANTMADATRRFQVIGIAGNQHVLH